MFFLTDVFFKKKHVFFKKNGIVFFDVTTLLMIHNICIQDPRFILSRYRVST